MVQRLETNETGSWTAWSLAGRVSERLTRRTDSPGMASGFSALAGSKPGKASNPHAGWWDEADTFVAQSREARQDGQGLEARHSERRILPWRPKGGVESARQAEEISAPKRTSRHNSEFGCVGQKAVSPR